MDVVIMAAGNGTRLFPLTENIPKPMVKIAGKTIIERIMLNLEKAGIDSFVVVVRYLKSLLTKHLEDLNKKYGWNIKIVEQGDNKGTAMAIYAAHNIVRGEFMAVAGDHVLDWRIYKDMLDSYNGEEIVAAKMLENDGSYGELDVEEGIIKEIREKPPNPKQSYVNLSIYIFKDEIFSQIKKLPLSPRGEYEITDLLTGKRVFPINYFWIDVGYYWNVLDAMEFILQQEEERIYGTIKNSEVEGKVIVEEGAKVINSYIRGNVYIGRNTIVGPFAVVENCSLEDNVEIGIATSVKRSLVGDGTKAKHLSYIGDSVIGRNVNFGGGAKIANLRLDGKTVKVKLNGNIKDSKRRKLGACIGDNVKIGVDVSIMPGRIIKSNSVIKPKEIVYENIV